jgi:5-formyltetrahydrofolate cyclo-ligase
MAQRDALDDRQRRSDMICTRIIGMQLFSAARAIHCFLPMRSEVDTRPIVAAALAAGKAVAVPVTTRGGFLEHSWISSLDPEAFEPGVFGTLRPRPLHPAVPGEWELTVVPLLAFDRTCYRLGYGKGYYDQLLSHTPGAAIGVAFAAQERPHVPREPHDVPLDMVVTEREVVRRS